MWSLGCILAELYTGYPLFPGENETEQLLCIMETMGLPPKAVIENSTRKKLFFDSNMVVRVVPNSRGKKRKPASKTLAQVLKCNDKLFLDFLDGCLRWDAKDRMTPEEGLKHAWILEALTQPATPTGSSSSPLVPNLPGSSSGSSSGSGVLGSSSSSGSIIDINTPRSAQQPTSSRSLPPKSVGDTPRFSSTSTTSSILAPYSTSLTSSSSTTSGSAFAHRLPSAPSSSSSSSSIYQPTSYNPITHAPSSHSSHNGSRLPSASSSAASSPQSSTHATQSPTTTATQLMQNLYIISPPGGGQTQAQAHGNGSGLVRTNSNGNLRSTSNASSARSSSSSSNGTESSSSSLSIHNTSAPNPHALQHSASFGSTSSSTSQKSRLPSIDNYSRMKEDMVTPRYMRD